PQLRSRRHAQRATTGIVSNGTKVDANDPPQCAAPGRQPSNRTGVASTRHSLATLTAWPLIGPPRSRRVLRTTARLIRRSGLTGLDPADRPDRASPDQSHLRMEPRMTRLMERRRQDDRDLVAILTLVGTALFTGLV